MHKPREETGNLCQHEETMGNCYGHVLIKVDISESKEPFALRGIRIEGAWSLHGTLEKGSKVANNGIVL